MGEPIAEYGNMSGICGHDGDDWRKVKVGADGALQIDVESTGNPSNLDIAISALRDAICAAAPTGNDLADIYTRLGNIQTELEAKLETADLNLDKDGDLQVDVLTAPTTAVTIADGVDVAQGAVADAVVAAGAVGTLSAKLRRLTTDLDALLTELKLKADLTETQPVSLASAPTTTVQSLGGDKLFAYESIAASYASDTNLSAGTNTLASSTPGAGKVWVITHISGAYKGTVPTKIALRHHIGAASGILRMVLSPVSDLYYYIAGTWILAAGDTIDLQVWGATAGDDLFLYIAGYQMDAP